MSKATLSGIEGGGANPTLDTVVSLGAALRVPLAELLGEQSAPELRVVRASADRDSPARRLSQEARPAGVLDVRELTLPARELRELAPLAPGARAHVYVIQGRVLAGPVERITELTRGDYAAFAADRVHQLETTGSPARILLVLAAPR